MNNICNLKSFVAFFWFCDFKFFFRVEQFVILVKKEVRKDDNVKKDKVL